MLLMKSKITTQSIKSPKTIQRNLVRPKAVHLDATNIIVGIVAVSVIVDVGKTFYAQYQRNQKKEEDEEEL